MTTHRATRTPRGSAQAVADVVERVFATVAAVHAAALRPGARDGFAAGGTVLGADVRDLLLDADQLAVGLGLVVAPQAGRPLRLEWWQVDPDGGRLRTLEPDLRPTSMGYYDYTATEWFDVPRRTGRRHVVGPYVDVHGTGRYLLTLTEPVVVEGRVRRRGRRRRVGPAVRDPPAAAARALRRVVRAGQRRGPGGAVHGTAVAGGRAGRAGRRSPPAPPPRWPARRGGCWPRPPRAS